MVKCVCVCVCFRWALQSGMNRNSTFWRCFLSVAWPRPEVHYLLLKETWRKLFDSLLREMCSSVPPLPSVWVNQPRWSFICLWSPERLNKKQTKKNRTVAQICRSSCASGWIILFDVLCHSFICIDWTFVWKQALCCICCICFFICREAKGRQFLHKLMRSSKQIF